MPRSGVASLALAAGTLSAHAWTVRVFAAASLTDAMEDLAANAKRTAGLDVSLNLAGSSTLVRQILEGAKADLVVTADTASMQRLIDAGLVEIDSVKPLLTNTLVIAASVGSRSQTPPPHPRASTPDASQFFQLGASAFRPDKVGP